MTESPTRRELIFDTVTDLVSNLLYYGRKSDEELSVGQIEKAISAGDLTVDEIVERFRAELVAGLTP